jgi:carbon storage regulator
MLVVTRKPGERIVLGPDYRIEVVSVERGLVKLGITVDQTLTLMPGRVEVGLPSGEGLHNIQVTRRMDDSVLIGVDTEHQIEVLVVSVKGEAVRIGIKAPREVQVYREEVYEEIRRQNIAAAQPVEIKPEELGGLLDRR